MKNPGPATHSVEAADGNQQGGEEGDRNGMGRKCPFLHRCKTSTRAKRGAGEDFSWIIPFFRKQKPSVFSLFCFSAFLAIP